MFSFVFSDINYKEFLFMDIILRLEICVGED